MTEEEFVSRRDVCVPPFLTEHRAPTSEAPPAVDESRVHGGRQQIIGETALPLHRKEDVGIVDDAMMQRR
jgi:hypothetical protein